MKRNFYVSTDFDVIKRRAWLKFAVMLMFFVVTTAGLIGDDISPEALLAVLPIAFLLLSVYQFIFYVGMLNCQLATLSALLQNSFNYKSIRIIDNVELYVTQLEPADESLIKLRAAMKVYNLIFEIGSLISDSFGSTTLMLLINFVIAATAAGYEAFIVVVGGLPTDIITGKWAVFALRNKALIRPWIKQLAFMSSSSQSLCSYRQYLVVMRHNGW